jgi:Gly-Xaa carboxypeptidase
LETSFKPRRTILLAFGQDEEASGNYGAGEMARILEKRYGRDGLEMVLDEGGNGLDDSYGPLMALPALAEKGG